MLKIRAVKEALSTAAFQDIQNELENASDASKRFAMSIPLNPEPLPPPLSTWSSELTKYYDEEVPLVEPLGIDLAPHCTMEIPSEGTAVVQRHGSKHDIEEHEVQFSVPNTGPNASHVGYIITNYDSRENVTDLLVVVPPKQDEEPDRTSKLDETMNTTTKTAREAIEQISSIVCSTVAPTELWWFGLMA